MRYLLPLVALLVLVPLARAGEDAEALAAISGMKIPDGLKLDLWAGDSMLANPVAFGIDERGRIYVCEAFRFGHGAPDNRGHEYRLLDDLATQTVEDRLAYYTKWADRVPLSWYTEKADRIRLLEDRDGDGAADHSGVFSDGYNDPAEGLTSGVLAFRGDIYMTNIPHLWLLRDEDGDGEAEVKQSLSYGYGPRACFAGHDLHGLVLGPDGKLYFSVGDRGYNIQTEDGRHLYDPMDIGRGAVFRCNLDGSELEVYAIGLRNPQELAFDKHGNLFTVDNNADNGDLSRFAYIPEGGDFGWSMAFQYMKDADYLLGPFFAEKLWHKRHAGQPAWVIPPLGHVSAGPSGFTSYPGLGLPERYDDHFFVADFRGQPARSGVWAFAAKPAGAGFEMVDDHAFLTGMLTTDVDFGYDGRMYFSDYIAGFGGTGRGRIYTLHDPQRIGDRRIAEMKKLFEQNFSKPKHTLSKGKLAELLEHPDMRVRLRAQYALAEQGESRVLLRIAYTSQNELAKLHAIWGLGQIGDSDRMPGLLEDFRPQVRAQAAKVLGELGDDAAARKLTELLEDREARVRYFAAIALGKLGDPASIGPIAQMLEANADADVFLRHAGVMAMARIGDESALAQLDAHHSPAVRLAAVLALRRMQSAELARFLHDAESHIVVEAARAIYDFEITAAMEPLAAMIDSGFLATLNGNDPQTVHAMHRRVINANLRLGGAERAGRVAAYASQSSHPSAMRREAVEVLGAFAEPGPLDRVLGYYRPLPERGGEDLRAAVAVPLRRLVRTSSGAVRAAAIRAAASNGMTPEADVLVSIVRDEAETTDAKLAALGALGDTGEGIEAALASGDWQVRAAARDRLAQSDPGRALDSVERAFADGTRGERQRALATLAGLKGSAGDALIVSLVRELAAGNAPPDMALDILEAAERRGTPGVQQALGSAREQVGDKYALALEGGDARQGGLFFSLHPTAQCTRCHTLNGTGGATGPDLTGVGARLSRPQLLAALLEPAAEIAAGFGTVIITLTDGQTISGILKSEDDAKLTFELPDGTQREVAKHDIAARTPPISAMPTMRGVLNPRQVRDVVEFLANQK